MNQEGAAGAVGAEFLSNFLVTLFPADLWLFPIKHLFCQPEKNGAMLSALGLGAGDYLSIVSAAESDSQPVRKRV